MAEILFDEIMNPVAVGINEISRDGAFKPEDYIYFTSKPWVWKKDFTVNIYSLSGRLLSEVQEQSGTRFIADKKWWQSFTVCSKAQSSSCGQYRILNKFY